MSGVRVALLRAAFIRVAVDCPACSPDECLDWDDEDHLVSMVETHGPNGREAVEEIDQWMRDNQL